MKKILRLFALILPLIAMGCGSTGNSTNESESQSPEDASITGLVITGAGLTGDIGNEAEADMNVALAKAVADKVESEINAGLESGDFDQAMLEADEDSVANKDFRVGLGTRGITVFMVNEKVPFAGGEMLLNGEIGLTLKFKIGSRIDIIASGELTSELQNIERSGYIKDVPYELSLNGSNKMELSGTFGLSFKGFKVKSMSLDLASTITDSDVVATGTVGEQTVVGTVDMVNVGIQMHNADILHTPKANELTCSGNISTEINDHTIGLCEVSENCLGCE